ncbi:hypothetical protein GCM10018952_73300 [Streptosporangium vulgare]
MTIVPTIGVFALQGDVREHVRALEAVGARAVTVRRPRELEAVDGLVVPGGESTTMWKLAETFELLEPLRMRIKAGMPAYGSCAGMIMLADRIEGGVEGQQTIGGIDHGRPPQRLRAPGRLLRGRHRLRRPWRHAGRLHPCPLGGIRGFGGGSAGAGRTWG